jgi:hypothetical protein
MLDIGIFGYWHLGILDTVFGYTIQIFSYDSQVEYDSL